MCFQPFVNKRARSEKKSLLYFFGLPHLSPAVLDVDLRDVTKGTNLSARTALSSQLGVCYIFFFFWPSWNMWLEQQEVWRLMIPLARQLHFTAWIQTAPENMLRSVGPPGKTVQSKRCFLELDEISRIFVLRCNTRVWHILGVVAVSGSLFVKGRLGAWAFKEQPAVVVLEYSWSQDRSGDHFWTVSVSSWRFLTKFCRDSANTAITNN